ncbi:MAG TPA: efflux RND transporter periplasmic adaptor subunit [Candidatus Polarisedimenticolia bacterium]|nr:efflux RND transporter periplasmic adaptor subunit [Candidatus Polarisedimenticolia bacterium]
MIREKITATRTDGVRTALALAVALAIAGCGGGPKSRQRALPVAEGLRLEPARLQLVPDEIEAPGSVIAKATAQVASRTTGTVMQVAVREGDFVRGGQLLAQLDDRELEARKSAAEAALQESAAGVAEATRGVALAQAQADIAKKTYDRYVYLQEQKSVSPQEFDEVESKQHAAQAGLEQAKARLQQAEAGNARAEAETRAAQEVASYARIVAPFEGRVVRRSVDPGSLVSPGAPLFEVENTGEYQLEADVPSQAVMPVAGGASPIRRGVPVRVELDTVPGRFFSGKVAEMEAGADPSSHSVRVKVALPHDPALQSGLFGRAWFRRGERRAIVVAGTSVIERGQIHGVFVADNRGALQWRVVTLGQRIENQVEVLSGLNDGEQVVVNPGTQELEGKRVAASSTGAERDNP